MFKGRDAFGFFFLGVGVVEEGIVDGGVEVLPGGFFFARDDGEEAAAKGAGGFEVAGGIADHHHALWVNALGKEGELGHFEAFFLTCDLFHIVEEALAAPVFAEDGFGGLGDDAVVGFAFHAHECGAGTVVGGEGCARGDDGFVYVAAPVKDCLKEVRGVIFEEGFCAWVAKGEAALYEGSKVVEWEGSPAFCEGRGVGVVGFKVEKDGFVAGDATGDGVEVDVVSACTVDVGLFVCEAEVFDHEGLQELVLFCSHGVDDATIGVERDKGFVERGHFIAPL